MAKKRALGLSGFQKEVWHFFYSEYTCVSFNKLKRKTLRA